MQFETQLSLGIMMKIQPQASYPEDASRKYSI